jgi:hypothetical protein
MKMKIFAVLTSLTFLVFLTGCVSTVDGRTKGGWPLGEDRISARYEFSMDQILNAARTVLKRNGQIITDDAVTHSIYSKVNTRDAWVTVKKVDEKVNEVIIQARNGAAPDVRTASDLSTQIGIQLAVSQ